MAFRIRSWVRFRRRLSKLWVPIGDFPASLVRVPFMFESYTPDTEVVLVKNPDFNWGDEAVFGISGPTAIDRLIFKILTDPGTRLGGAGKRRSRYDR